MKKYAKYIVMGIVAVALSTWLFRPTTKTEESSPRDYEDIRASGVLRAVTEYNSISYHASGDSIEGFHYELLKAFAKDKGLEVEMIPKMSFEERVSDVLNGRSDILANSVMVTSELKDTLLFTCPIVQNRQILVQRKAENEADSSYIHNQLELAQKTLHVVKGSPSILRIRNLSNEIGDTIYIKEIEKYGQEQLMAMVANGDIDYAVCDENIAKASLPDFPMLDIHTAISFTQFYSWGVSKQSPALLDSLNHWLEAYQQTKDFKRLRKKYYKN